MCGRYALASTPAALKAAFGYLDDPFFPPRFNIAPTQPVALVRTERVAGAVHRRFALARWGFVPAYVKAFDTFKPVFNAWTEGLADKPMFRNAIRRRRCIIPADGYYVWRQEDERSRPFLVRRVDRAIFGLAGLWEGWAGADGSEIDTACIITALAADRFAALHPRRPVVIDPANLDRWLDPDETLFAAALPVLDAQPAADFEAVPIGPLVNKAVNDQPEVQVPVGPVIAIPASTSSAWPGGQAELF